MANEFGSRLAGTLLQFFRIGGAAGIRLKNASGVLNVRNALDTAWAALVGQTVKVQGSNETNGIVLSAPGSMAANVTYTLPGADGSTGDFLKTDGAGTLDWAASTANADQTHEEQFTQATGTADVVPAPPDNATLLSVIVEVESAASSGAPTISIGTSADPDAYMLTSESDLTEAAVYRVNPMAELGASPAAIQMTVSADGQTFSGRVYVSYSVPG